MECAGSNLAEEEKHLGPALIADDADDGIFKPPVLEGLVVSEKPSTSHPSNRTAAISRRGRCHEVLFWDSVVPKRQRRTRLLLPPFVPGAAPSAHVDGSLRWLFIPGTKLCRDRRELRSLPRLGTHALRQLLPMAAGGTSDKNGESLLHCFISGAISGNTSPQATMCSQAQLVGRATTRMVLSDVTSNAGTRRPLFLVGDLASLLRRTNVSSRQQARDMHGERSRMAYRSRIGLR